MPSSACLHRHPPRFPARRSSDLSLAAKSCCCREESRSSRPTFPSRIYLVRTTFHPHIARTDPASRKKGCHSVYSPYVLICMQILIRSEEHTSELQSPCNLVCRLLPACTAIHPASLHDALPI